MITPTIGRVVWFRHHNRSPSDQPKAAIVVYVHSDHLVNLAVFDYSGEVSGYTSVPLIHEGDELPVSSYCEWMSYQIGQARKTEELETKLNKK